MVKEIEKKQQKAIRAARMSMLANLLLALAKGLAGFFGHSFALIADAIESSADVFASMLVLLGLRYASRPADENHPYGHGKIEPLVTFVVVGFLVASAVGIAIQSVHNIQRPHELPRPFTLFVLGGIIVIKEGFYRFMHQSGKESGSTSLRADAWHHRSDALTSLAAFVGISMALLLGEGYEQADDWAALIASGVIVYNAYLIFRPALGEIMDEHLYEDMVQRIRHIARQVEEVKDTEKCFIRKSGMRYHIDLHLVVDGNMSVRQGHEIAHQLKNKIKAELPEVADVLIHVEPDD
ncbi:MAG: cation transporter [Bacteroidetes bacterium]|nr:MAG: cation transporter [Bacteroidota bacterium]